MIYRCYRYTELYGTELQQTRPMLAARTQYGRVYKSNDIMYLHCDEIKLERRTILLSCCYLCEAFALSVVVQFQDGLCTYNKWRSFLLTDTTFYCVLVSCQMCEFVFSSIWRVKLQQVLYILSEWHEVHFTPKFYQKAVWNEQQGKIINVN